MPPPFNLRAYSLVFIPGTKLFQRACEEGIISGISYSAHEINFLPGFDHRGYEWNRKNLYLCSIHIAHGRKVDEAQDGVHSEDPDHGSHTQAGMDLCYYRPRIGEAVMGLPKLGFRVRRAAPLLLSNARRRPY